MSSQQSRAKPQNNTKPTWIKDRVKKTCEEFDKTMITTAEEIRSGKRKVELPCK